MIKEIFRIYYMKNEKNIITMIFFPFSSDFLFSKNFFISVIFRFNNHQIILFFFVVLFFIFKLFFK